MCFHPCISQSVHASIRDCTFPWCLQYLFTDFHRQTSVIGASWDKDELIKFWGQRSTVWVKKKSPPKIFWNFFKWLGIFSLNFTHLLVHLGTKMNWLGFGDKDLQCESNKIPPAIFWNFLRRLGIFSPNFTHLLYVPIYAGLKNCSKLQIIE